jgi:general L-amino acid transport system permease protein
MSSIDNAAYIRHEPVAAMPPPSSSRGAVAWAKDNLFSSPANALLTLAAAYIIYITVPVLVNFLIINAVWTGADRDACDANIIGRPVGACWAYITDRVSYFIYGSYPLRERWRVDIFFAMLALGVVWMLWLEAPYRSVGSLYFFVILPIASFLLLVGNSTLGLPYVDTSLWGGILVTFVISSVGIVFSLPFGVLLALGRRSRLPVIRLLSVVFIEIVRGVPLITVLFMANTMLPLFVPADLTPDRFLRPLIGVAIFASAYMAEVVRGGLQAIPKGQYEGAMSLGIGYWRMMRLIILPQALRIVIPGIVNTFIGLFKDTTLVVIVGIFDFLRTIQATLTDPAWATPTTSYTGYAFAAVFYFLCCYGMSRYSIAVENRLMAGQKR